VPARDIPELVGQWRAGRLPVELLHTGTLPLDAVNAAFDALADGQVVRQLIVP
jgi:alcohol dehydrogenase